MLSPGAWAGSVIETTDTAVYKRVSQDRWDKTRMFLQKIGAWVDADSTQIPRKDLERIRGFLVYVATTYSVLTPYLRGIHLTLDSWRPNRDSDGWVGIASILEHHLDDGSVGAAEERYPEVPGVVKAVPRLLNDLAALRRLTGQKSPPDVLVRPIDAMAVIFIYGDASGMGYGISLWKKGDNKICVEYGEWTKEFSERSSNQREMVNFVIFLEQMLRANKVQPGSEIFVFTDNQVTESAFHRGTSSSRALFELVLRLRQLEMEGRLFLRVIWVAGTRMIAQGTDGFSRGDLENGVAAGLDMLSFVPLNETAFERQPNLEAWLRETLVGDWETLNADGWYEGGMEQGQFIWAPAPASADAALDQLCEAKHIRPECSHLFVCPALLTPRWRRKLGKISDFVFCIPVGTSVWEKHQHEPVIVGLICPLLVSRPWQIRYCGATLVRTRLGLSQMWSEDLIAERDCLREFWMFTRSRSSV